MARVYTYCRPGLSITLKPCYSVALLLLGSQSK